MQAYKRHSNIKFVYGANGTIREAARATQDFYWHMLNVRECAKICAYDGGSHQSSALWSVGVWLDRARERREYATACGRRLP